MRSLLFFSLLLTAFHQSSSRFLPEDTLTEELLTTAAPSNENFATYPYILIEEDQECLSETQLDSELIKTHLRKDFRKVLGENQQLTEYFLCLWKKYGYLKEYGSINKAYIRFYIGQIFELRLEKTTSDIMKACDQGEYKSDTAVKLYNCIINHTYGVHNYSKDPFRFPVEEQCLKELEETFIEHLHTQLLLPEGNDEINKYVECVAKSRRYVDNEGQLDYVGIRSLIEPILQSSLGIDIPEALEICAIQDTDSAEVVDNCIIDYLIPHIE